LAIEGPDYPPHPPLARPGWWRDARIWIGAAVILFMVVIAASFGRVRTVDGAAVISALLWLFNTVVLLYMAVLVAVVIMSWLTAFKVADPDNAFVARFDRGLYALTNPVADPVRRVIPAIGGLDFSPIVVLLLLAFLRVLVNDLAVRA
jgi:YggT family protein